MQNSTIKKLGALAALIATTLSASAVTFECDGIFYNILSQEEKTVEVTYDPDSNIYNRPYVGDLTIPSVCQSDGQEFQVVSIGMWAFSACGSLTSVTIPNSVTSIGECAFDGCSGLTSVTIPNSVTNIAGGAFVGCSGLTSVTIPSSVTSIGRSAFAGCNSLTNIQVESGNPHYSSFDGVIFNVEKTSLIMFPPGKSGEYQIPNSVTNIAEGAFGGCSKITSVTISNSVTNIAEWAFSDCSSLTTIEIPNSVTSIGNNAFHGCSSLVSVTIPNSVTNIAEGAFSDCSSLTTIEIPNSVTSIGNDAFHGCSSLVSVTIPNSVTNITGWTFSGCSGLTNIQVEPDNSQYSSSDGVLFNAEMTSLIAFPGGKSGEYQVPNSVKNIRSGAFDSCDGVTSVTIPNSVTRIEYCAFRDCSGLISVTIPNSVTKIEPQTFYGCISLTTVTIPNSVTNIAQLAFFRCSSLTTITIPNSVTSIGGSAFSDCRSLNSVYVEWTTPIQVDDFGFHGSTNATLYVPRGSMDAYNAADPWNTFAHIEEYDPEMSRIDAVEQAAAQPAWHVEGGRLHIDGETVSVMIFNAAGANIYNGPSDRIPTLPHGLYIAKIGNTTAKLSL